MKPDQVQQFSTLVQLGELVPTSNSSIKFSLAMTSEIFLEFKTEIFYSPIVDGFHSNVINIQSCLPENKHKQ